MKAHFAKYLLEKVEAIIVECDGNDELCAVEIGLLFEDLADSIAVYIARGHTKPSQAMLDFITRLGESLREEEEKMDNEDAPLPLNG